MISPFLDYIRQYIALEPAELKALEELVSVKTFSKGKVLLREGEISQQSYFNIRGCVRLYYLADGKEITTYFYTENQFVISFKSLIKKLPAQHYFECLEDTTLAIIPYAAEQELLQRFPKFEHLNRVLLEEELSIYQDMLASYITEKPEERYRNLLKKDPALINRIPQYHLASFIGVKPESLSRIRRRMLAKVLS